MVKPTSTSDPCPMWTAQRTRASTYAQLSDGLANLISELDAVRSPSPSHVHSLRAFIKAAKTFRVVFSHEQWKVVCDRLLPVVSKGPVSLSLDCLLTLAKAAFLSPTVYHRVSQNEFLNRAIKWCADPTRFSTVFRVILDLEKASAPNYPRMEVFDLHRFPLFLRYAANHFEGMGWALKGKLINFISLKLEEQNSRMTTAVMRQTKLLDAMLAPLEARDQRLLVNALKLCGNVTLSTDAHTMYIFRNRMHSHVMSIYWENREDVNIQKICMWILANLAAGHPDHIDHLLDEEQFARTVAHAVGNENAMVRREGGWVLLNACSGGRSDAIHKLVTRGFAVGFPTCLTPDADDGRLKNCLYILRKLTVTEEESGRYKREMLARGVVPLLNTLRHTPVGMLKYQMIIDDLLLHIEGDSPPIRPCVYTFKP